MTCSRSVRPKKSKFQARSRTTFYPWVQATAKEFRLAIRPDARPEAGHFYRSDHFSLARVGIPSFSINEGMKFKATTKPGGRRRIKEYTEKRYHQPSDKYDPAMDFTATPPWRASASRWAGGGQLFKINRLQKGDEFEPARVKSQ